MNISTYQKITKDIEDKIRQGVFIPGQKIFSRREICIEYNVSNMTAYRVQQELQNKNLIRKIPGKGFALQSIIHIPKKKENNQPLSRICLYAAENAISKLGTTGHVQRIYAGVTARAMEHGISTSFEVLKYSFTDPIATLPLCGKDEGIIAFGGIAYKACTMALFCDPDINMTGISMPLPGKPSVSVDNLDGISELLNYLESQKCRKVLYEGNLEENYIFFVEDELSYFFEKEASRRDIVYKINTSATYPAVIDTISEFKPDAIMFPTDITALRVKKMLGEQKKLSSMPLIVGYKGVPVLEPGAENLTTYQIDCEAMGAAAVDCLVEANKTGRAVFDKRIKGKLLIRK